MKIKQTTLTVFAAIVVPSQSSAANRGGIQAVVFPKWNSTSANNFVAAVNEAASSEFELRVADEDDDHLGPT